MKENLGRLSDDIDFEKLKGTWLCERMEIPYGVYYLSAGVSIEKNYIWFVLLGWGLEGRKYVIHAKPHFLKTRKFNEAEDLINYYCDPENYNFKRETPKFTGGFITSDRYSNEIFAFCILNPGWSESIENLQINTLYKTVPGNSYKYLLNINTMKSILNSYLNDILGEANSILFPEDCPELLFTHIKNQKQYKINKGGRTQWRWGKYNDKDIYLLNTLILAMFAGVIENLHKLKVRIPSDEELFDFKEDSEEIETDKLSELEKRVKNLEKLIVAGEG
jgi:phage terminase large subunit GpA-like protein